MGTPKTKAVKATGPAEGESGESRKPSETPVTADSKKMLKKGVAQTSPIPKSTPATQALGETAAPYALHTFGGERGEEMDGRRVFKTIIVETEDGLVAAMVPLTGKLDLSALAFALGFRSAKLPDPAAALQATGYDTDVTSPLGLATEIPVVVDTSMARFESVLIASGLPGMEIEVHSANLINITGARSAPIAKSA